MKLYYRDENGVMRVVDGIKLVNRKMKVIFIEKSVYTLTGDDNFTTTYHRVEDAKWYLKEASE